MLEIGTVVGGQYKVLNIIGKGGMSIVYLAMNEKVNKQWAIKEIIKRDYQDFEIDKKEIEMMKKLKHPNLPSIVDVIENQNSLLIVMDYIEGQSLEDIVSEQGAQAVELVLQWAEQLCDVLNYLHKQIPPIIYRDMKPANVMVKPDDKLMLIDFGAAREYKPYHSKDTISLGTQGYAAPEQYREDGQSDARTDIYCLGVMLFQLLTGESPYELCPIRELKPELSSGLETIILKCTQIKKEDRYQTAEELLYAIKHYWEYDEDYRKEQKKRFIKFMIPATLTALFFWGAITFWILENSTRMRNYEQYIANAVTATENKEKMSNYLKAISLNPERFEGYMGILENCFLDDGIITKEESEQLRNVLVQYDNGKQTNEAAFRENSKEYGMFAYEAGIAYFYRYEDKSNKKNAKGYFEVARSWKNLNEQKKERAKRLYVIADYYSKIGVIDEAGDTSITYRDYWEDLVSLSEGNLVKQDNARTALVMYEEIVGQIIARAIEFRNDGVLKEDILRKLQEIKKHLETDFDDMNEAIIKTLQVEIECLKQNINIAEKMIQSAYGKEK